MSRVVLFGATGGLGAKLAPMLAEQYIDFIPCGSRDLDLTNLPEVERFFRVNEVDVVINFAGINRDGMLHKISPFAAAEILAVNVYGSLNILTACLVGMRERQYGRIIFASSMLSTNLIPGTSVYSASKAFVDRLIEGAAIENAMWNICCNTLQLGYFDAGMTQQIAAHHGLAETIPARRFGTIQEIKQAIDFLIRTPYVNGSSIRLGGGL